MKVSEDVSEIFEKLRLAVRPFGIGVRKLPTSHFELTDIGRNVMNNITSNAVVKV